jgi:pilus assembly protein CpaF
MLRFFFKASARSRPNGLVSAESAFETQIQALSSLLSDDRLDEIWLNPDATAHARLQDQSITDLDLHWSIRDTTDFIIDLAERVCTRLDPFHPYAGGIIPGYPWRWHAFIPPLSPEGPRLSLRRQRFSILKSSDFSFDNCGIHELSDHIRLGRSLLFFGATGSGKTSLMVQVLRDYFYHCRVGIVETVQEIPLISPYWFRLTEVPNDTGDRGGISFSRVVAELMRATPDFIVLGEIRGREARYLGELARSGHGGIFSTIHASNFEGALARLASLAGTEIENLPAVVGVHVRREKSGSVHASISGITTH